jgi:hypothetical protein
MATVQRFRRNIFATPSTRFARREHYHVFWSIPWGTDAVACLTQEIGLDVLCLAEWYDVGDAESLSWLQEVLVGRSK